MIGCKRSLFRIGKVPHVRGEGEINDDDTQLRTEPTKSLLFLLFGNVS